MNKINTIYQLVTEALAELDQPNHKTSSILRKAIRIATLRNDYENLLWLQLENTPVHKFFPQCEYDTQYFEKQVKLIVDHLLDRYSKLGIKMEKIITHFSDESFTRLFFSSIKNYLEDRKISISHVKNENLLKSKDYNDYLKFYGGSVAIIENQIDSFNDSQLLSNNKSIKHEVTKDYAKVLILNRTLIEILTKIEERLYDFLIQSESQLLNNQLYSDLFERIQLYVDARLADICPKALEQFKIAYQSLTNNHQESNSHALTSCRRILESVADALYPANDPPVIVKGSDKKERKLTQDKYINRLWQFVDEKVKGHTAGKVLLSEIDDLGNRINKVYDLSCKGVHSDISNDEAEQCFIKTYFLIGDILRLEDGDSAILRDNE